MIAAGVFSLLHLLVFAYWLGGDIGVFYASTLLTDAKRDAPGRIAAAKILADVDLVPRICLLLALPTGLGLAIVKGWLQVDFTYIALSFLAAFSWIWLILKLHASHGGALLKKIDTYLRYAFLVSLLAVAISSFSDAIALPLFITLKLLILAFAILMGLLVRRALEPFGPAFSKLVNDGPDDETNRTIKTCLDRARPAVIAIWAALILAAWLGVTKPI